MVGGSFNPFRRRKRVSASASVLDTPVDQYDEETRLPRVIRVGHKEVQPFVTIGEVRDHLTVLSAFHRHITSSPPGTRRANLDASATEYQRWAQYVIRRVDLEGASAESAGPQLTTGELVDPPPVMDGDGDDEDKIERPQEEMVGAELPPIGVLMCWHAHMLNPKVFDKECEGAYALLKGRHFPLRLVAEAVRDDALPTELQGDLGEDLSLDTTVWDPIDIADAVLRQGKYIDDMNRIGWLEGGGAGPGVDVERLQRGVVRYHAWLDLMRAQEGRHFLVPTLDIDLAWHTHQLHGKGYKGDTEEVLGFFLDHNDNAGDAKLGDGLRMTGKLWKEKFGHEYQY